MKSRCLTGGRGLPGYYRQSAYGSGFDGIRINAIAPAVASETAARLVRERLGAGAGHF
jgi:hypothetical protein